MTRDKLRVRVGRRVQRLGRWIAHGGSGHRWCTTNLGKGPVAFCGRCGMMVEANAPLRHGGLAGRCPTK